MRDRSRLLQIAWLALAVAFFVGAGMCQVSLDSLGEAHGISSLDVAENHPGKALLTMAPGGLRAPVVAYLWMRADKLKRQGRHHEAVQLAEIICKLQPNFPSVWDFYAWDMAWNISVATHTPEERWRWVYAGVELLRDKGIPQNRDALYLYQRVGWIFYNKMGGHMDDMHMAYKQRWAALMQRLLGTPAYETTAEAIEQFRPIAESPLDKDLRRQKKGVIQQDQLDRLLAEDAACVEYAKRLQALGIQIDSGLLEAYNRYSFDFEVRAVRPGMGIIRPETEAQQAVAKLINSAKPEHVNARRKLLSFVRAQVLWNDYKMDPQWMLGLMEKFGPLDWRLVLPHGLYWVTYGLHVCEDIDMADINSLNTSRIVMFCLKTLSWNGRLSYIENPNNPDMPAISWSADWRFIEPTQKEYLLLTAVHGEAEKREYRNNPMRSGHVNFIQHAVQMLFTAYRLDEAREMMKWVHDNYKIKGDRWTQDVESFVIETLKAEGDPIPDRIRSQIASTLTVAFVQRAKGNSAAYLKHIAYARRAYDVYQAHTADRNRLMSFRYLVAERLYDLIIWPGRTGVKLSLLERSDLYRRTEDSIRLPIYDLIAEELKRQCKAEEVDFATYFPAPRGLAAFRKQRYAPK